MSFERVTSNNSDSDVYLSSSLELPPLSLTHSRQQCFSFVLGFTAQSTTRSCRAGHLIEILTPDCFAPYLANVATTEYCSICLETAFIAEEFGTKILMVVNSENRQTVRARGRGFAYF